LQKYLYFAIKLSLLKPSFHYQAGTSFSGQLTVYLQIGEYQLLYIAFNNQQNCLAVAQYQLPNSTETDSTANTLKDILTNEPLLKEDIEKMVIVFSYPKAILVPDEFMVYDAKKELMQLQFGDLDDLLIKTEFNTQKKLHIIYAVPKSVETVLNYVFAADIVTHQYALLPNIRQFNAEENVLYTIFQQDIVCVMLIKKGQIQIMQQYNYKTPEDVAYYLLQICKSFEVLINEVTLSLSGLIDKDSVLFQEIFKYFLHIQFETLPEDFVYSQDFITNYPAHYFSNLFSIAACV
jgi:hypothetical protein